MTLLVSAQFERMETMLWQNGGFVGILLFRLIFNYAGVTTDEEWHGLQTPNEAFFQ